MQKEELIRVFSAYLPYNLKFISQNEIHVLKEISNGNDSVNNLLLGDGRLLYYDYDCKPILYDLSFLKKTELHDYGLISHIDYLTSEREHWIEKHGFLNYINELPHGHFVYLLSQHYNVFNLPKDQYIDKATLKTKIC